MSEHLPLESCVCGDHFDCPDGWHYGDDVPCTCTPDCAFSDLHFEPRRLSEVRS